MPYLKKITTVLLLFLVFTNHSLAAKNSSHDYATDRDVFEIPGHGEIILNVPRVWNYNFTWIDENQPPIITFYILDKQEHEIFQLNMSVLWEDGFERDIHSPAFIRSLVEKTGESVLGMSDETELQIKKINGNSGEGFLFELTDSRAAKGEYKYLTQGALPVGELLLVFSLFCNEEKLLLNKTMLKMISGARHHFRKDV